MKLVIFTDLDGTLLDARTYSFEPAAGALGLLGRLDVPLVFCTSKTRAEILLWRERLDNSHPFISENGGGVFIPRGYFGFGVSGASVSGGFEAVALGTPYAALREAVAALRAQGIDIRGFGDMTPEEVAGLTGLDISQAHLAMQREYDEPFVVRGGPVPDLVAAIEGMGLRYTTGRLMHIMGGSSDKGRAVLLLKRLYERRYGQVVTAAVGDSANDLPMLEAVDHPFAVKAPEGGHNPAFGEARINRVNGVGPEGWAEAVGILAGRLGLG